MRRWRGRGRSQGQENTDIRPHSLHFRRRRLGRSAVVRLGALVATMGPVVWGGGKRPHSLLFLPHRKSGYRAADGQQAHLRGGGECALPALLARRECGLPWCQGQNGGQLENRTSALTQTMRNPVSKALLERREGGKGVLCGSPSAGPYTILPSKPHHAGYMMRFGGFHSQMGRPEA